jgi:hypothetical protein
MLLVAAGSGNQHNPGEGETVFYASAPHEPFSRTFTGRFGCHWPGCTATGKVFDVPRDQTRSCYLNVGVYVTDFLNNMQHPEPEIVTEISVYGGYPRKGRIIRTNCHPDGANQQNTLFYCVQKHRVDDLVGGADASRSI